MYATIHVCVRLYTAEYAHVKHRIHNCRLALIWIWAIDVRPYALLSAGDDIVIACRTALHPKVYLPSRGMVYKSKRSQSFFELYIQIYVRASSVDVLVFGRG